MESSNITPFGTQSCPTTPQRALQASLPPELFRQAVLEHAEYLGMDPQNNADDFSLMWIAERSLLAPLPEGWVQMSTDTGQVYYCNELTGESDWNHPRDEEYRNLFLLRKSEMTSSRNNSCTPMLPAPPPPTYMVNSNSWSVLPPTLPPNPYNGVVTQNSNSAPSTSTTTQLNDDTIEKLKIEVDQLRNQCNHLSEERDDLNQKVANVERRELDFDALQKNSDKLKEDLNSLKIQNNALELKVKQVEDEAELNLENLRLSFGITECELRKTITTLEGLKKESDLEKAKADMSNKKSQSDLAVLRNELNSSKVIKEELQMKIEHLETGIRQLDREKESVIAELDSTKSSASITESSLQSQIQKLITESLNNKSQVSDRDSLIKSLEAKVIEVIADRDSTRITLDSKISELDIERQQLKERYEKCERKREEDEQEMLSVKLANERLTKDLETVSLKFRDTLLDLESKMKELDEFDQKVAKMNSLVDEMQAILQTKEKDCKRLQTDNSLLNSKITSLEEAHRADKEKVLKLTKKLADMQGSIRVLCRIRPPGESEILNDEESVNHRIKHLDEERLIFHGVEYEYDHVFQSGSEQEEVFEEVSAAVETSMQGCNVCIFAYGQTGSGKTYTMLGPENNRGVNIRSINSMFQMAEDSKDMTYSFHVSIIEVYNEKIRDLLSSKSVDENENHDIRMGSNGAVFMDGVSEHIVARTTDVEALIKQASNHRMTANNNVNEISSRSHLVLTCTIVGVNKLTDVRIDGKLTLIDLAGSERLKLTEAEGIRLKEAQNINRSLSALGDVIAALGSNSKHVPYRNSKLTFLLQDSLRANSKCLMFVNINPSICNASESICSLNFAKRCKAVNLGKARRDVSGQGQSIPKSPIRSRYPMTPTKTPTKSGQTLAF